MWDNWLAYLCYVNTEAEMKDVIFMGQGTVLEICASEDTVLPAWK